jgi:hypothetical protein
MRGRRRLRPCCGEVNLTRASDRAMACQWTRPHSEARRKRRRHVVKRSAAITATILWRTFDAQPVAARRTIRIQTLHRPTGQILHSFASQNPRPRRRKGGRAIAAKAPRLAKAQNWRDCALGALVSQGESIQLVVVLLQTCGKRLRQTLTIRLRRLGTCRKSAVQQAGERG